MAQVLHIHACYKGKTAQSRPKPFSLTNRCQDAKVSDKVLDWLQTLPVDEEHKRMFEM